MRFCKCDCIEDLRWGSYTDGSNIITKAPKSWIGKQKRRSGRWHVRTHPAFGGFENGGKMSWAKEWGSPLYGAHQALLTMGILQARILEWVAMPSSRGSSQPRDQTQVSQIAGGFFTIWATREIPKSGSLVLILLLRSRTPSITLPVLLSIHRSQKYPKLKHFQEWTYPLLFNELPLLYSPHFC